MLKGEPPRISFQNVLGEQEVEVVIDIVMKVDKSYNLSFINVDKVR